MKDKISRREISLANREILRRINRGVSLKAKRFANSLLSGVFRAIFRVEQSYEIAEPEGYELEHEPERILWNRIDDWWVRHLPLAIANEQVLAARYHLFTEYDFIVLVDVSHSMMLRWWGAYGGTPMPGITAEESLIDYQWQIPGDRTKLFLLKYTLAAFLHAAKANDFYSVVMLFGGNTIKTYNSRQETYLAECLLQQIDEHYERMVRAEQSEYPLIGEALRRILVRRRQCIVLCISDFIDTLQHVNDGDGPRLPINEVMLPLAEIAAHHRLLVLRINDKHELFPTVGRVTADIKNSVYLNSEKSISDREYPLGDKATTAHADRTKPWQAALDASFARYGIRTQQIVAQRDDEKVDCRIYELGAQTWS